MILDNKGNLENKLNLENKQSQPIRTNVTAVIETDVKVCQKK